MEGFFENFEVPSPNLTVTPWSPIYDGGSVITGAGSNATQVMSHPDFTGQILSLSGDDQFEQGSLEFDLYSNGGYTRIHLLDATGWNTARLAVWSSGGGQHLEVALQSSIYVNIAEATDIIPKLTWNKIKVSWDTTAETVSVSMNDVPLPELQNIQAMEAGFPGGWPGKSVTHLRFYAYSGTSITQWDNIRVHPLPTRTISGNVGVSGATISGLPGSPVSDGSGDYSGAVPEGWIGTVTPFLFGYNFTPISRIYAGIFSDISGEDYTPSHTISGNVGVAGVAMNGLPGNPVSNGSGDYTDSVPEGWSGTVAPELLGYIFDPVQRDYINLMQNQTSEDYTPTVVLAHTISGNVGAAGVTMAGLPGNPVVSQADGDYSGLVLNGWSGTVTPTHAFYNFTPMQHSYNTVTLDQTNQDYVENYQAPTLTIVPPNPNIFDQVSLELSATWPDDAVPYRAEILVSGSNIYFDVYDTSEVGQQTPTPWQLEKTIGPLLAGAYTVNTSLLPQDYDQSDWLANLSSGEATNLGLDMLQLQQDLDAQDSAMKNANHAIAQSLTELYEEIIVSLYNETMVNLGYLQDELEGLRHAIVYSQGIIDTAPSAALTGQCDTVIANTASDAETANEDFYAMFVSSAERYDPVAAIGLLVLDPNKVAIMESIATTLVDLKLQIADQRRFIVDDLRRLRNDPAFATTFTEFTRYSPPPLPPVHLDPNGNTDRLIFGGSWGRTETMLALEFDTLSEEAYVTWDSYPDGFTPKEKQQTLDQWENYQVPISDAVMFYALGDGMYRPPFFTDQYGDSPDYYFRPSYYNPSNPGGGFDYRHPVPRQMILEFLEGAAAIHSQYPYTFAYKGPWEPHPYTVPGSLTFEEHGHSVPAIQAFRDYLQTKYGTIANLNSLWQSAYASFNDINPPTAVQSKFTLSVKENGESIYIPEFPVVRYPATPLTYEFERCRKDLYMEYFADCYDAVKRGDPVHPLGNSNSGGIMDEQLIRSIDDLQLADRCVDMWGKHPSGGKGWADAVYQNGLNHYFNKTLVSLEFYGYAQEEIGDDFYGAWQLLAGATTESVYNSGRRDVWHEYNWGRKMLLFYWPTKMVELKLPPSGELYTDGFRPDTSPLIRPWINLIPVAKRRLLSMNDIIVNVPMIQPNIGIVHPGVSIINAYPTDGIQKTTEDIMDRLVAMQYQFDLVAEEYIVSDPGHPHHDTLDRYDVLILPYMQYFDNGFADKLLAWVGNGGTLISVGPFGVRDKLGFVSSNAASLVYPGMNFGFTAVSSPLSWLWTATGGTPPVSNGTYDLRIYGSGTILMTLDGRSLFRPAVGAEAASLRTKRPPASDIVDPGGYSPAQQAFYDILATTVQRKAWVTSGNVDMVVRQDTGGTSPLYVSVLNWDYKNGLDTTCVVDGEYSSVTDLSLRGSFPIPVNINAGQTSFSLKFGPGEGYILELQP